MNKAAFWLAIAGAVVASCSGPAETQPPEVPSPATERPNPSVATPTPGPSAPGAFPGVLMIDYGERAGWDSGVPGAAKGALVALEGETGAELAWWKALDVGQAADGVPSPDGRLLALTWHAGQSTGSQLRFIDLATGAESDAIDEPRNLAHLTWSSDSRTLYGIVERSRAWANPSTPGLNVLGSGLWALDASTGDARLIAEAPFQVAAIKVAPDGGAVYALAFTSAQCCGIDIEGDPFLVAIDTRDGGLSSELALPGLVLGQRFEDRGRHGTQMNILRTPGIAITPAGDRIFVAHADEDLITVVDVKAMALVETVMARPKKSLKARLGSWLGGLLLSEASAKGGAYFAKEAAVSPDGRWLYVTGTGAEICEDDAYFPCVEHAPMGLQVIDTGSMEVVARHEGIGRMRFTANMERIVGWGFAYDYRVGGDRATEVSYGPYVIDSATHVLLAEPQASFAGWGLSISSDGRYGYTVGRTPEFESAVAAGKQCTDNCSALRVVDLATVTVVATRVYNGTIVPVGLAAQR